jgi:glycosyltransferase involved in cell wall biosynthesis
VRTKPAPTKNVNGRPILTRRSYFGRLKILVLTTSYPRSPTDPSGRFVADAVDAARRCGHQVEVVSPAEFRHFGIAYGHGMVGNLKARPWLVLLLPAFLWNFRRAALGHDCDLVHAHWLAAGLVSATLRRPFVVQIWGTDAELARRVPWLARWILRRGRLAIAASPFLAEQAASLGARDVRVVPAGVDIPDTVREPDHPPHVLYAGRLSAEKGIEDFLCATEGLPRVVAGAGPIHVAESVGAVAPTALGAYYERAAVVCVPSRREGYGMVAREAMAYGRPVVATRVGGLVDAVDDDVSGLLVGRSGLRAAIERLLDDPELRARFGSAAREKAGREWSREASSAAQVAAYRAALGDR